MPDDPDSNWERLKQDCCHGPLVLFVGAGINGKKELLWGNLLTRLWKAALDSVITDESRQYIDQVAESCGDWDSYRKATVIKALLGRRYIPELQKAIYGHLSEESIQKAAGRSRGFRGDIELLTGIAELCCLPDSPVHAVVTYNYDDYFGMAVNSRASKAQKAVCAINAFCEDLADARRASDAKVLPIYHVHGYIAPPWDIRRPRSQRVVLSYDEYFHVMLEPNSWQTTTQLHFLMNYTCLFVGASLTDVNMLRMLASAKRYGQQPSLHGAPVVPRRYALVRPDGDEPKTVRDDGDDRLHAIKDRLRATMLAEVGVLPIFVPKAEQPEKLEELLRAT